MLNLKILNPPLQLRLLLLRNPQLLLQGHQLVDSLGVFELLFQFLDVTFVFVDAVIIIGNLSLLNPNLMPWIPINYICFPLHLSYLLGIGLIQGVFKDYIQLLHFIHQLIIYMLQSLYFDVSFILLVRNLLVLALILTLF